MAIKLLAILPINTDDFRLGSTKINPDAHDSVFILYAVRVQDICPGEVNPISSRI